MSNEKSLLSILKKEQEILESIRTAKDLTKVFLSEVEKAREEDKEFFMSSVRRYSDEVDRLKTELTEVRKELLIYLQSLSVLATN